MIKNGMRPVHPGEILFEEFMKPSERPINANMLAKALEVPANRVTAIINGQRGITGDTAVRLATFFNTTAEFWMNLQKTYGCALPNGLCLVRSESTSNSTGKRSSRPDDSARRAVFSIGRCSQSSQRGDLPAKALIGVAGHLRCASLTAA